MPLILLGVAFGPVPLLLAVNSTRPGLSAAGS